MSVMIKRFSGLTPEELYQMMALRSEVFVLEQNCVYQDPDGKDPEAIHIFYMREQQMLGYLRVLPKGISYEEPSIGRVCVSKEARGMGLARRLMKEGLQYISREWNEHRVRISAQLYLKHFYESLGFVGDSEVYLEDGIEHLEMVYEKGHLGLLIIDVQNAMFTWENGVYAGQETLDRIVALQHAARDYYIPIIRVQHTEETGEFSPEDPGWQYPEVLQAIEGEPVVEKHYADSFLNTKLDQVLTELGIRRLIVVGMQTEYCMDTTIRNGFSRGYKLMGVKGCHTTFDSSVLEAKQIIQHHEQIWDGRFLTMLTLEQAIAVLAKA